ncbi:MAG: cytochrome family [Thermoleophilaceae bacterium]|nr:cytochrome family [Thermoleophilaceae bacterium]
MPKVAQLLAISYRTIPFLESCRRRFGDCFAVHMAPFGRLVYVADTSEIKRIFTGDPKQFHAGEANAFVLEQVLGKHSLLVLDEDAHLAERKLLLPHFHGESVRRYAETMEEIAIAEIDSWPLGATLPMRPAMQRIGLETILKAVIGVSDPGRLTRLRGLMASITGVTPLIQAMWIYPWLGRFGPWKRYRRRLAELDRVLYEEIAARRSDPSLDERNDILSLLIANGSHSDAALRDELMTLLVAGHETTATGLAWAFERLVRHPDALAAAASADDAYLDAVVKETLRVRPVVVDVVRTLTADTEVAGYTLPAGTIVLPAIALVQRSERHYDGALDFRPERFLEGSPEPYTWIPFGGGVRRCIGAAFATLEMKVVLRAVLSRVELGPARQEDEGTRMSGVTMLPARGGEVVVRGRIEAVAEPALASAAAS